jgi:hypothetical protein
MTKRDPGTSPKAIRARVQLFASERRLAKRQIVAVTKAASNLRSDSSTEAILNFATAHDVDLNWLISGDLHGLLRRKERAPDPEAS